VDEPSAGGKGPAGNALPGEPDVFAFTKRFETLGVRGPHEIEEGPSVALRGGGRWLALPAVDRIEGAGSARKARTAD
jgi:hypothetical protein